MSWSEIQETPAILPRNERVVEIEPTLSIYQRVRLVEIAHKTKDERIREEALALLKCGRMMVERVA